jgi:pimeloyl-ACP methyl ester carboxylesterase
MAARELSVLTDDGVTLHGEQSGPADHDRPGVGGDPIVLLHGLTATRHYVVMGSRLLERSGHRVIAYDARGHGRSTPAPDPAAYGYERLARDLAAVLDALQIPRAALAGASMGAHTALRFALDHPERVAALGIVTPAFDPTVSVGAAAALPADGAHGPDACGPAVPGPGAPNPAPEGDRDRSRGTRASGAGRNGDPHRASPGFGEASVSPIGRRFDQLARALREGGVEGFVRAYDFSTVPPAWRETIERVLSQRLARHEHPEAVADAMEVVSRSRPFEDFAELARIAVPTAVVASRDEVDPGHPFALAERYARAIPGATLTVEDGGAQGQAIRSPIAWQGGQLSKVFLELLARARAPARRD